MPTDPGFFTRLYLRVLSWANNRHAVMYLSALSFAESSFFPIPPDVLLIPMCVAQPARARWFAAVTTLSSVLGGLLGYAIGYFAAEFVQNAVAWLGYESAYAVVLTWFRTYGSWIVFIAGFSPIPYKLFTIGAGTLGLAILPFAIASIIGRGARFFLVAILVSLAGPRILPRIERYIEWIGWIVLSLVLIALFWISMSDSSL